MVVSCCFYMFDYIFFLVNRQPASSSNNLAGSRSVIKGFSKQAYAGNLKVLYPNPGIKSTTKRLWPSQPDMKKAPPVLFSAASDKKPENKTRPAEKPFNIHNNIGRRVWSFCLLQIRVCADPGRCRLIPATPHSRCERINTCHPFRPAAWPAWVFSFRAFR